MSSNLLRASLLLLVGAVAAPAALLYEQAPCSGICSSPFSAPLPQQEAADPFTPDANWLVDSVSFRGAWFPSASPTSADFEIRFFVDNGGLPMDNFFYSHSATIVPVLHEVANFNGPVNVFNMTTSIAPVALSAGQTYWISILSADTTLGNWAWLGTTDPLAKPGSYAFRSSSQSSNFQWIESGFTDVNYALSGQTDVPEPGSFVLLGLGLVALGWRRRPRP